MIGMRSQMSKLMTKKCTKCGKRECDCKKHESDHEDMFSMKDDDDKPVKKSKKTKKKR